MKTSWRSASLVASAAAVMALTTACGQDSPPAASQNVGATAAPGGDYGNIGAGVGNAAGGAGAQASPSPSSPSTANPAGKLSVSTAEKVGKVVTDSLGLTLYRFDQDTEQPPKSNCDGDCAKTWPPVPADDAEAGEGIDKALLGSVTRADGTKQLTVGGWPAYRYAKDVNAGDVKGQGVGGKWYALAPDGKKAQGGGAGAEAGGEAAGELGLSTRNDPKLGEIVVDKNGMTVYRFKKDEAWPKPVSNCSGECLKKWPLVEPVDFADTKGIQEKGYMIFERTDGKGKQQTINCSPIYTFAGDKAPGDTNGQGVGGTWYAVRPDGKLVGASE
ncbi:MULTISPECIES: SCO0930 family lipoprotein [unclassified Streptomyces]|uniref:SCO0930 family lipoprotein n=1 Tax=unclassified Streptomyces TaxID=2593676 RepID=UPI0004C0C00C|nr:MULTISPECIES: SCO0930 family lipoprotein [unclassified Streptomyces]